MAKLPETRFHPLLPTPPGYNLELGLEVGVLGAGEPAYTTGPPARPNPGARLFVDVNSTVGCPDTRSICNIY